jgi:hypothetical protein
LKKIKPVFDAFVGSGSGRLIITAEKNNKRRKRRKFWTLSMSDKIGGKYN